MWIHVECIYNTCKYHIMTVDVTVDDVCKCISEPCELVNIVCIGICTIWECYDALEFANNTYKCLCNTCHSIQVQYDTSR